MIRANQTQPEEATAVCQIIDTGLAIGHTAFAGMDGVDVRMSQADVEALTSKLRTGRDVT